MHLYFHLVLMRCKLLLMLGLSPLNGRLGGLLLPEPFGLRLSIPPSLGLSRGDTWGDGKQGTPEACGAWVARVSCAAGIDGGGVSDPNGVLGHLTNLVEPKILPNTDPVHDDMGVQNVGGGGMFVLSLVPCLGVFELHAISSEATCAPALLI